MPCNEHVNFFSFFLAQLPFYLLTELLHKEAKLVELQVQLVYREDLHRQQRHKAKEVTRRLEELWSQYTDGQRTAVSLLAAGSRLICPRGDGV